MTSSWRDAPSRWHLEQILREAFAHADIDATGHYVPGVHPRRPDPRPPLTPARKAPRS